MARLRLARCSKPVAWLLFLAIAASASKAPYASELTLAPSLTASEAQALAAPVFWKETIEVEGTRLLVVTRDYGFGLELREAYVYRWDGDAWELVVFRKATTAMIRVKRTARDIQLVSKSGNLLVSIPTESLRPGFGPREH